MADESSDGKEGTQITVEMATEIVKKAGLHVLPQAAFVKIREEAAAKAASEAAQAKAELERVNAEYQKARDRLKSIDDQGKSTDDIWRDRQAEWTRQLEAEKARASQAESARQAKERAVRDLFRDRTLQEIIAPTATSTEAARAAHLLALQNFPSLSTDDNGRLTYTDPAGIEHVGDEAQKTIAAWWAEQKWAHRAPSPGPATHGGGPAPSPTSGPVYPPGASRLERQRIALEYEDSQRTGRK